MSPRGYRHYKMKCPDCGKATCYSDDADGHRWLRRHKRPDSNAVCVRHLGKVATYWDFWKRKGFLL